MLSFEIESKVELKSSRFLCLCVDGPCKHNFDHSFLFHTKSKYLFSLSHQIHMNALYLPCKFWIQSKTTKGRIFELLILWWPITTPIPCSIVENFYSSTKFEFFYQKIKLELPTTWLTQKHLIDGLIWIFVKQVGDYIPLHQLIHININIVIWHFPSKQYGLFTYFKNHYSCHSSL